MAVRYEPAPPGATSRQVRVLRSTAGEGGLTLLLEGRPGERYEIEGYTDRPVGRVRAGGVETVENARALPDPVGAPPGAGGVSRHAFTLLVTFDGAPGRSGYVRREVVVPLR